MNRETKWKYTLNPPVIARKRIKALPYFEEKRKNENINEYMKVLSEILELLDYKIKIINREIDESNKMKNSIINMIELQNEKIEIIVKILESMNIEKNEMPDVIKESHIALVNLLVSKNSFLSYEQIAKEMNVSKSSVRVYVSELQKLGFPLLKKAESGKTFVCIPRNNIEKIKELYRKYGFEI